MAVAPRWSASTLAEEAESNFLLKWSSCFRGGSHILKPFYRNAPEGAGLRPKT